MPDTRAIAKCFSIIDLSRVPNELEPLRELLTLGAAAGQNRRARVA